MGPKRGRGGAPKCTGGLIWKMCPQGPGQSGFLGAGRGRVRGPATPGPSARKEAAGGAQPRDLRLRGPGRRWG